MGLKSNETGDMLLKDVPVDVETLILLIISDIRDEEMKLLQS